MKIPYLEKVQVSELASYDLGDIWEHISLDSIHYADKTIDEIVSRFAMIDNFPLAGSEKNDLIDGLRLFPYNDYNIFYFPTESGVEIFRVLHSARNNVQIFGDLLD